MFILIYATKLVPVASVSDIIRHEVSPQNSKIATETGRLKYYIQSVDKYCSFYNLILFILNTPLLAPKYIPRTLGFRLDS
jgi:hypothetical protein